MFADYDKDKSGFLEYNEIPDILRNIYKGIRKNYEPTDVNY
jgi:Ca2+-binding EF-hand superfamily protein